MDSSSIVNLATDMANARAGTQIGTAVLKKAMEVEAQSALALLEALPQSSRLPSHLGQNINTTA